MATVPFCEFCGGDCHCDEIPEMSSVQIDWPLSSVESLCGYEKIAANSLDDQQEDKQNDRSCNLLCVHRSGVIPCIHPSL